MGVNTIDARGLLCPEPVLRAQRGLSEKPAELVMLVDTVAARENVTRFAASRGYDVAVDEENGEYSMKLTKR